MFAIVILALLLKASYAEDCGHWFDSPINTCSAKGFKILCDDQSGSEIITVEKYDNEMCTGQATIHDPQEGEMDWSARCAAIDGACSCSTTTCEIFEWDYEKSCNYASGGTSVSSGYILGIVNKCVPYRDSGHYVKWECNENFDATDPSLEEMPVIAKIYTSSECDDSSFVSNEDSFELDNECNMFGDCPYQTGSTGDQSVCSYFNYYPIGQCATYYLVTDADEETHYDGDQSTELVCSNGTYTKNYYNSVNCTGDITESLDITEYCIDCNCYDSDSDGDGDSLLCDIAKEGWRCSNNDTTTFYVLENCINQTQHQLVTFSSAPFSQYECRSDNHTSKIYYSDNECQVEKVDICSGSVNYDSKSEAVCAAKWITTATTTSSATTNVSNDSGVSRVNMIRAAVFVVTVLFWNGM